MSPETRIVFYSYKNKKFHPISRIYFSGDSGYVKTVFCWNEIGDEIGFKVPDDGRIRRVKKHESIQDLTYKVRWS